MRSVLSLAPVKHPAPTPKIGAGDIPDHTMTIPTCINYN
jgi:hypothetical protein